MLDLVTAVLVWLLTAGTTLDECCEQENQQIVLSSFNKHCSVECSLVLAQP